MVFEIWCNGKLHYTRPVGHPDLAECLELIERTQRLFGVSAYEIRPTKDAPDLLPAPACCASFVSYGVHHRDCRLAQTARGNLSR